MPKATADQLARVYRKINGRREALKKEFNMKDTELVEQLNRVRAELQRIMKENGSSSMRTEFGTIIKSMKRKYWTSDWDTFYKVMMEHKTPELLTRSIHQSNLQQFLDENPDIDFPGLNADVQTIITVRKPTQKGGGE